MEGVEIGVDVLEESKTLDEQSKELSSAYANYMIVDLAKERAQVNESTDELLTKLEEFLAVVDLVRSDSLRCLEHLLPKIEEKYEELQHVFVKVDKLEILVNNAKEKVEKMSELVTEAEKRFTPESSISKLLSPLFTRRDNSRNAGGRSREQSADFQPPAIFKARDYISISSDDK